MVVIIDCETDSDDSAKANLKYFGGLNCETGEYTLLSHENKTQILDYIKKHKVICGFNFKSFDKIVLENFGVDFKYKVIIDLWECLAPMGDRGFGKNNKDRLHDINPSLVFKNYKLKTIIEVLGLDDEGKGEIDYEILKKDKWSEEEINTIEKYLRQDLLIEKKLFDWYADIFKSLKPYLTEKQFNNYNHLTCSSGSLAYKMICKALGLTEEYDDTKDKQKPKIEGGHHITPRYEKVRGDIVCRDFVSQYPHIMIMYNLHREEISSFILRLLQERLTAKRNKDKQTALSLKVPLNSIYGITAKKVFKHIYNPEVASDCTRIGREHIKKYAKNLDVAGFVPLYGFTDSVYVGIPKGLTEEDLSVVTECFIDSIKKEAPNPIDSFNLGVDSRLKFIWFIGKKYNNYLYVNNENQINIKGGLFNKNTPVCILELFDNYITPKIKKELDVNFTEEELLDELKKILKEKPESAGQIFSPNDKESYKTTTSINYKILERYGYGNHNLIPITKEDIGVGQSSMYCSLGEFKDNNLGVDSIAIDKMMRVYLKPFYSTKEKVLDLKTDTLDTLEVTQ